MSFGTSFIHETYFNRETFDELYKVENAIIEEECIINSLKSQLLSYAIMTEPNKLFNIDEDTDLIDTVITKTTQLMDDLIESSIRLNNLKELKSEWDNCHTVKDGEKVAKSPLGEYPHSYLCGDFIKSDMDDEDE